jgi:hypothetical protein
MKQTKQTNSSTLKVWLEQETLAEELFASSVVTVCVCSKQREIITARCVLTENAKLLSGLNTDREWTHAKIFLLTPLWNINANGVGFKPNG